MQVSKHKSYFERKLVVVVLRDCLRPSIVFLKVGGLKYYHRPYFRV